jgi:hypothetical protein
MVFEHKAQRLINGPPWVWRSPRFFVPCLKAEKCAEGFVTFLKRSRFGAGDTFQNLFFKGRGPDKNLLSVRQAKLARSSR